MIAAASGFDAIYVDLEHNPIYVDLEHNPTSLETASTLCVAAICAGITPMVRIGSQDGHLAARVLDGGAQGLMVPPAARCARRCRADEDDCSAAALNVPEAV